MAGPTPTPTPTPTTGSTGLSQLLKDFNIQVPTPTISANAGSKLKPVKNGIYTATTSTRKVPTDDVLASYIDSAYNKYYGRSATQTELQDLLPEFKNQYKDKSGADKTTIKYNYKNGQLISTDYYTAQGIDPKTYLDDKIKGKLATGDVVVNKLNTPEGPAGQYFVAIKNLASQNGISLSDSAAKDYAVGIASGQIDQNTAYNTVRESAANAFPSLGEKIKSGINLKTLADPYIQSMSNILEIPDTGIDLFDPKIRGALSFTMPDGKVGTKSIYDFEKELRQDPRWQYTNNARQQAASVATTVLKDFGFMG